MTKERRNEAFKYIEAQLEDGYLDLGLYEEDELEIVKEAINMLKIVDEWNEIPLNETLEKIWDKSDLHYNTYALNGEDNE